MYALAVENLSTKDDNRGVPGSTKAINRWHLLYQKRVPDPVYLLPCEGERQLTGETITEVIDIQLNCGHGRSGKRSGWLSFPTTWMEVSERIKAVSKFLLESPPGEINDVLNGIPLSTLNPCRRADLFADVRNIIADDDSLQEGIAPALREYNLAQFVTVDVPGSEHQVSVRISLPVVKH